MNFQVFPFPPAAGAASVASRVQLPAVGRVGRAFPELGGKALPPAPPTAPRDQRRGATPHQAQHRTECRAACMSKANF